MGMMVMVLRWVVWGWRWWFASVDVIVRVLVCVGIERLGIGQGGEDEGRDGRCIVAFAVVSRIVLVMVFFYGRKVVQGT